MKRIFLFPSIEQAKEFILTEPHDPVFVAGVGMAETAAAVVRAVKAKKPHLIVLCGLGETYDPQALPVGEVVEVVTEQIPGVPGVYETSAPDTGLPIAEGATYNCPGLDSEPSEESLRDFRCTADPEGGDERLPVVGNFEGAAFFAVCDALGVAGCEIRAIANRAGEKARPEDTEKAIQNLTRILTQTFPTDE